MRTTGILLVAAALLVIGYCYIAPLASFGGALFSLPLRVRVDQYEAYYSVLAVLFGFIAGVSGLTLGYFYFENRKRMDRAHIVHERVCANVRVLLAELDACDELVTRILVNVADDIELRTIRESLGRRFDSIEAMLELHDRLLNLTDADCRAILAVNSYVEKSDVLMRLPLAKIDKNTLFVAKTVYVERIRLARRVCFTRIARDEE